MPSSPISFYNDIATSLILQPTMDSDDKLTKALATMEHMEKLMEALNNDLETVKEENCYLKAVVETNNDLTNPDHPLYEPPARSHFSPPTDNSPLPPIPTPQPSSAKPEIKCYDMAF